MLSNAYFVAKNRLDTAESEPAKNLQNFADFPNFATPNPNNPFLGAGSAALSRGLRELHVGGRDGGLRGPRRFSPAAASHGCCAELEGSIGEGPNQTNYSD